MEDISRSVLEIGILWIFVTMVTNDHKSLFSNHLGKVWRLFPAKFARMLDKKNNCIAGWSHSGMLSVTELSPGSPSANGRRRAKTTHPGQVDTSALLQILKGLFDER